MARTQNILGKHRHGFTRRLGVVAVLLASAALSLVSSASLAQDSDDTDPLVPAGKPIPGSKASSAAAKAKPSTAVPVNDPDAFERAVRVIGKRYTQLDKDYYANALWDPKYPSSRGQTLDDVLEETSYRVTISGIGSTTGNKMAPIQVRRQIPKIEAEALARALPRVGNGEYGYIHSAIIKSILSPDEMWVEQAWLIDEAELDREKTQLTKELRAKSEDGIADATELTKTFERREELAKLQAETGFRKGFILKGIPTHSLATKSRYLGERRQNPGMQVVFVGSKAPDPRKPNERVLLAIAGDKFKQGLSKEQFAELLTQAGMTPDQFLALIAEQRRVDSQGYESAVIRSLEAARQKNEPPPPTTTGKRERPSSEPKSNRSRNE